MEFRWVSFLYCDFLNVGNFFVVDCLELIFASSSESSTDLSVNRGKSSAMLPFI